MGAGHLPRHVEAGGGVTDTGSLLRRRFDGTYTVDEWGLDRELVELLSPLLSARYRIEVEGADRLTVAGPAVLVFSRRFGLSEPIVLARAVRLATDRVVRPVGVPDIAPAGTVLRRLGGVLGRADEVAGVLRRGGLVGMPLSLQAWARHRAGELDPLALAPAVESGATVQPVAVIGREWGRRWRVLVGEPLDAPTGKGPLAAAELAGEARRAVQDLLDAALPPRWPI